MNNNDLTIISQNCLSYFMHQKLNVPYNTPFVDIKIDPWEYIRYIRRWEYADLTNVRPVRKDIWHDNGCPLHDGGCDNYPLIMLDECAIIHPIHCFSLQEFKNKWMKRVARMNFHKLLFIYQDEFPEGNEQGDELFEKFIEHTECYPRLVFTPRSISAFVPDRDTLFVNHLCSPEYEDNYFDDFMNSDEFLNFIAYVNKNGWR